MRVNIAFGILVGFAMLELLLLQVAVLIHAHAITKPAFLPMLAEGGGGLLEKRNKDNRMCDHSGYLTCQPMSFCLLDAADTDGFLMCCPDGADCRPPTTCMDLNRLSTEACLAQSGCLACVDGNYAYCVRAYNNKYRVTSYACGSTSNDISMYMAGDLVANIPRWEAVNPDSVTSGQPAQPTVTTTAEPGTVAEISSASTESHESVITSSAPGGVPTIVTITVNGQSGQTNTSTAASTPKPSTASDNESSQSDTGKKAGIAIGVLLVCGLAAVGAWFVYRRYFKLRRNNRNALWQSPSAGPHHNPNAVELDAMDT